MSKRLLKRMRGIDLVYGKIQKSWDKTLEKHRFEQHSKKMNPKRLLRRIDRDDESMFSMNY